MQRRMREKSATRNKEQQQKKMRAFPPFKRKGGGKEKRNPVTGECDYGALANKREEKDSRELNNEQQARKEERAIVDSRTELCRQEGESKRNHVVEGSKVSACCRKAENVRQKRAKIYIERRKIQRRNRRGKNNAVVSCVNSNTTKQHNPHKRRNPLTSIIPNCEPLLFLLFGLGRAKKGRR